MSLSRSSSLLSTSWCHRAPSPTFTFWHYFIQLWPLSCGFPLVTPENNQWFSTYKGCVPTKNCPSLSTSFTFPSKHERRTAKCCYHDFCNKGAVKCKFPPQNNFWILIDGCYSLLRTQKIMSESCSDWTETFFRTFLHYSFLFSQSRRGLRRNSHGSPLHVDR